MRVEGFTNHFKTAVVRKRLWMSRQDPPYRKQYPSQYRGNGYRSPREPYDPHRRRDQPRDRSPRDFGPPDGPVRGRPLDQHSQRYNRPFFSDQRHPIDPSPRTFRGPSPTRTTKWDQRPSSSRSNSLDISNHVYKPQTHVSHEKEEKHDLNRPKDTSLLSNMGKGIISSKTPSIPQPLLSRTLSDPSKGTPSLSRHTSEPLKGKPSISLSGFGKGLISQKIRSIAKKSPSLGLTPVQSDSSIKSPPMLPQKIDTVVTPDILSAFAEFEQLPSKVDILRDIDAVDSSIAQSQSVLQEAVERLDDLENEARIKAEEVENAALEAKFLAEMSVAPELLYSKNVSVRIYAENLWKATSSAKALDSVCPAVSPENVVLDVRDFEIVKTNAERFAGLKRKMFEGIASIKMDLVQRREKLLEQWKSQEQIWISHSLSKLRKQRDELSAEFGLEDFIQDFVDSSHNVKGNRKVKDTLAVLPDQIIDEGIRRFKFINHNGYIADPKDDEKRRKAQNPWTNEEKAVFRKRFLKYGKNFRRIASHLPRKSHNECVAYYYLSKHSLEYKKLDYTEKTTSLASI